MSRDPLASLPDWPQGEFFLLPLSLCPFAFCFYQKAIFTIRVKCTLSAMSQE